MALTISELPQDGVSKWVVYNGTCERGKIKSWTRHLSFIFNEGDVGSITKWLQDND